MSEPRSTALILGATSDIGRAIAHRLAEEGYTLQLAARDREQLAREAGDVELRYQVPVSQHVFDILQPQTHAALLAGLNVLPDVAVCVVGLLGEQDEGERDFDGAERVMITNYLGPARLLGNLANRFEARGSGTLVGISSVAGDRGRATNYIYGSAKAGFTAFLSGLRNRLAKKGVHVVTVKPGFVRTRMTEGIPLPGPLTTVPLVVGEAVVKAIKKKTNVIYVTTTWRCVMLVIRLLPERLFKIMKI